MTAYTFENIGAAEAEAYRAAVDSLQFSTPGASAGHIQIAYDTSTARLAITFALTGRTVVFGPGFAGEQVTFADGSMAMIGASALSSRFTAGAGNDALFGGLVGDDLTGGAGNDTLVGGVGGDHLSGGSGDDLFIVYPGDSLDMTNDRARDLITDWESGDRISFNGLSVTSANFAKATAASSQAAIEAANALIATGAIDVVAVQVGTDVMVFADTQQNNGEADDWVTLTQRGLADIDVSQFAAPPVRPPYPTSPAEPALPPPPAVATTTSGYTSGNMDAAHISGLLGSAINGATSTNLHLQGVRDALSLGGTGFVYDANQQLVGGTITALRYETFTSAGPVFSADLRLPGISAAPFGQWIAADANQLAFSTLLANSDHLTGSYGRDLIRGYGGDDVIYGGGGGDSLFGGDGNDQLFALQQGVSSVGQKDASTYLRGEAGNDYIVGGDGFDDMHGNTGDDTVSGGQGADWVVGGQGQDLLFGDVGNDIVYGNMGDDTCWGGDGADTMRGGQANDTISGGAGNDWISGDRGDDTINGGAGADTFYTFGEAGIDRIVDFNAAEGDRVQLDPWTTHTARQVGDDTIIEMGGGGQMVLVGVNLSALPTGWIFTQ